MKWSNAFVLFFFVLLCIQCTKQHDPLKPTMGMVDSEYVVFNDQKVKINALQRTLNAYKTDIESSLWDSIQIQFELEQGVDQEALGRIKEQIQASGIKDLKFIAPFSK